VEKKQREGGNKLAVNKS